MVRLDPGGTVTVIPGSIRTARATRLCKNPAEPPARGSRKPRSASPIPTLIWHPTAAAPTPSRTAVLGRRAARWETEAILLGLESAVAGSPL
jgi:hypothetical protein